MTNDLKPCPFCGGEAYIRNSAGGWYVRCANKKRDYLPLMYEGSPYYPACFLAHTKSYGYETKEQAITAWNQRAERTCKNVSDEQWSFECSECGAQLNWNDCEWGCVLGGFCFACGAKVVE